MAPQPVMKKREAEAEGDDGIMTTEIRYFSLILYISSIFFPSEKRKKRLTL